MAKKEKAAKAAPSWEIKDRLYEIRGKNRPVAQILKSRNILWFDEEKGYEREIKYTSKIFLIIKCSEEFPRN